MGEFSADWLALREPADRLARSLTLTREMAERLSHSESIRVLDLATGTGSNVRYLAPHFRSPQQWRLIDRDAGLLKRLPQSIASWALRPRLHHDRRSRRLLPARGSDGVPDRSAIGRSVEAGRCRLVSGPDAGDRVRIAGPRVRTVATDPGGAVRGRSRRGPVRAHIRRADRMHAGRTGGRPRAGTGQPASADRQGLRARARS